MQYVTIICDEMFGFPLKELNNKTSMQVANKPSIDYLASKGTFGLVKMIPGGAGFDRSAFSLSSFGYCPLENYFGRAPLEIDSFKIDYSKNDVLFRCDFVTLSEPEEFEKKVLLDFGAEDLFEDDAKILIDLLNSKFGGDKFKFFCGKKSKNYMVWKNGRIQIGTLTSPCDVLNERITNNLPNLGSQGLLFDLIMDSNKILSCNEMNRTRSFYGKMAVNSIWLWGEGRKTSLKPFFEKFNLKGSAISDDGVEQGIGKLAGFDVVEMDCGTDLKIYFEVALEQMNRGKKYLHLCVNGLNNYSGGKFNLEEKIKAIEKLDELLIGPLFCNLKHRGECFKILITSNFSTQLTSRYFTKTLVPFLIYDSRRERSRRIMNFSEESASKEAKKIINGHELIERFIFE